MLFFLKTSQSRLLWQAHLGWNHVYKKREYHWNMEENRIFYCLGATFEKHVGIMRGFFVINKAKHNIREQNLVSGVFWNFSFNIFNLNSSVNWQLGVCLIKIYSKFCSNNFNYSLFKFFSTSQNCETYFMFFSILSDTKYYTE